MQFTGAHITLRSTWANQKSIWKKKQRIRIWYEREETQQQTLFNIIVQCDLLSN